MKKTLAIISAKVLSFVGGFIGKGTSMPGSVALKICPDILSRLTLPQNVIAVTGSNGKTTTVEYIAKVCEKTGRKVIWNKEGSNQTEGVTTLLLKNATLSGKVKGDIAIIECDERYTRYIFKHLRPTHFVVTNLFRDQLTRNAHPFFVYDAIAEGVSYLKDTKLILNADDPIIGMLSRGGGTAWFGMNRNSCSSSETDALYEDCFVCPKCGEKMGYSFYHYSHLGDYKCQKCGYARQKTDYTVNSLALDEKKISINGDEISLAMSSRYNVYNICAAYAVCREIGIDGRVIAKIISESVLKNGRTVTFTAGENSGMLITSKHENSTSYNRGLEYITTRNEKCELYIIVDAISRKYYTTETSWLWDISFEKLIGSKVNKIYLCGTYAFDLGARFDAIDIGIPYTMMQNLDEMSASLNEKKDCPIYVLTCFSDKDKLFSRVKVTSPTAK